MPIDMQSLEKLITILLKKLVPFTIIGSVLGVRCVLSISEEILNVLVVVMILIVAIYTFISKNLGQEDNFEAVNKKNLRLGMLMALIMGFYDGFFGPGTGTFLTFGFIKIYGYDFLHASANTKILNLTSNITSLLLFMINGQVDYKIAIVFALVMIMGAYVGAKVAIKKGSKMIKPIFLVMALFMVVKLVYQTLV
ncbi:sulfite exporter TauE/SafE family protein [Clostridioides difficile]|uniref:sulfite exporter TauE/SafE family protein n=1 Tax=Clostridioides difficile TaxID=1496 RepID=UPI00016C5EC6|nr:TSUP family transporter [Clostridioides difficile]